MPVRNEAAFIETSLRSVLMQDYPAELTEVIVVDGMSDDGTVERVASIATEMSVPTKVIVLTNERRYTPAALNQGIEVARGQVVIRVDGHCELDPDYISRCVDVLLETGADNVGGVQRAVGEYPMQRAIALATSSPFGVGNARFRYASKREDVDTVYLGAFRRDVFTRIGGFDEDLTNNQDDELNLRLRRSGGRIILDPAIRVRYRPRRSLRTLWRQYFRYGLFKVRVMQKAGGFTAWRHYVPAAFVLGVAGGGVAALATGRLVVAIAVPGLYLMVAVAASIWTTRGDPTSSPLVLLSFMTLHGAYGVGFLWGIWRWRRFFRRRR